MRIRNCAALAAAVLAFGACADTTAPISTHSLADIPTLVNANAGTCVLANGNVVDRGPDLLGYNRCAGLFRGPADGTDGVLDGAVWGDPTYANDRLVMKWNESWDVCNANRSDANCESAWLTNEWNGMGTGGSGQTWHYKFKWSSDCKYAVPLNDGGYCIWREYEVILSHGTAGEHFWDAHAKPGGFGN